MACCRTYFMCQSLRGPYFETFIAHLLYTTLWTGDVRDKNLLPWGLLSSVVIQKMGE